VRHKERALHRVGLALDRGDQVLLQRRREPRPDQRKQAADHGDLRRTEVEEACELALYVERGLMQDRDREGVTLFSMREDAWRESSEVGGLTIRLPRPEHRVARVIVEVLHDLGRERREHAHALMRPERASDSGTANSHATALVADVGAPATDIEALAFDQRDPGAARADDEDGAIAAFEGAHEARPCVGVDHERGEGVRPFVDGLSVLGLLGAGEPEAGMDAGAVFLAQPGRGDGGKARPHDAAKGLVAEACVARSAVALAEKAALSITEPR